MARRCRERGGQEEQAAGSVSGGAARAPITPCPHHPMPCAQAGASVVPLPSPPHSILSAQARKASPRSLPPTRIKLLPAAYGRGMPGVSRHEART